MSYRLANIALGLALGLAAQDQPAPPAAASAPAAPAEAPAQTPPAPAYVVDTGTKIPLSMINSISTKHATPGDRIYLETVFPILANGKIVIPPGSYVAGTVTDSKRPGRVKGRGELYVRFDSLTLPNGVTRDFRARMGSLDGRASEDFDKEEGRIKSEGNKSGDARTIGEGAGAGAGIGGLAGAISGHPGMGAGIGAAAGAAAGLIGVLLTRGPDAVLAKGTTLEMILDRPLQFEAGEINFSNATYRTGVSDGNGPMPSRSGQGAADTTGRRRLGLPY